MTLQNIRDPGAFSLVALLRKTPIPRGASWVQHGYRTKGAGRKMVRQNATCLVKFRVQVDNEHFSKYNYVPIITWDLFILKTGLLV